MELPDDLKDDINSLPHIETLKKRIAEFDAALPNLKTADEVDKLYTQKIKLQHFNMLILPPTKGHKIRVYRVRASKKFIDNEDLISSYTYPPASLCKVNGRANLANTSVFYSAIEKNTAWLETHPQLNDYVYLTEWSINIDTKYAMIPFYHNNLRSDSPMKVIKDKEEKEAVKQLNGLHPDSIEKLSLIRNYIAIKFAKEEKPYRFTSWFADKILHDDRLAFPVYISYPSFAQLEYAGNMVFHRNFADRYMRLERLIVYKVINYNSPFDFKFTTIKAGYLSGNKITFRHPTMEDINYWKTLAEVKFNDENKATEYFILRIKDKIVNGYMNLLIIIKGIFRR